MGNMRTAEEVSKRLDHLDTLTELNKSFKDSVFANTDDYINPSYLAGYKAALHWVWNVYGYSRDTRTRQQRLERLEAAFNELRLVFADPDGIDPDGIAIRDKGEEKK